jgi:hypothetical protein
LITKRLITQSIDLGFREGKGSWNPTRILKTLKKSNTRISLSKTHFKLVVKADVQLKSSIHIGAKVEISCKDFTLRVKAEIEKIISICPKL